MTGKGEQIDWRRLQVDRHHARRLGRVNQEERARLSDEGSNGLDWLHGSQDIGGVGHRDERCCRTDGARIASASTYP